MAYAYLAIAIIFIAAGQVLQKMAARQLDMRNGSFAALAALLESPFFWGAALVMGVGLIAWLMSLSLLDVGKAYPMLGLTFVVTTAASVVILKERVGTFRWIGVALISAGAAIMMTSP